MIQAFHEFLSRGAKQWPQAAALVLKDESLSFGALWDAAEANAAGLASLESVRGERLGVWPDKRMKTITPFFGASLAGTVFVPINPVQRQPQAHHLLTD